MTLLAEVVRTSTQVAATSSRLEKIRLIAECLRGSSPTRSRSRCPISAATSRQGKLALGYATLQSAHGLRRVGARRSTCHGRGRGLSQISRASRARARPRTRSARLKELFGKATAEEQDFLLRLIVGELRQGALEGVMLEAVAAAASLPPAEVRRAATFAGGIAPVARAALADGAARARAVLDPA